MFVLPKKRATINPQDAARVPPAEAPPAEAPRGHRVHLRLRRNGARATHWLREPSAPWSQRQTASRRVGSKKQWMYLVTYILHI